MTYLKCCAAALPLLATLAFAAPASAWCGAIEQSASAIAAAAIDLYQNPQAWQQAQQHGQKLLAERYLQSSHGPALVERIKACRAELEQHRRNNFTGAMLRHHQHKSTQYMSQWIEAKNRLQD